MTIDKETGRQFPRGAKPSPRYKLLGAEPFRPQRAPLVQTAMIPAKLQMWGNNQFGDCVSAEEAFAKATHNPEILLTDQAVIDWARRHGVLDGATLTEVLDAMQSDGYTDGPQRYNDGPYKGVNYADEPTLQAALAEGPVKIAIDADALPSGAGNKSGWYAVGKGRFPNTDHCVALCGFGAAEWLYQQLGVPLPSALAGKDGYLLFTWSTIGFVDHDWLLGTCVEAWLRQPTTVGIPPLPGPPTPNPPAPTPPNPPVPPPPAPTPPSPLPPWLSPILRWLCANVQLPPQWQALKDLLCGFLPPGEKCGQGK